MFDMNRRQVIGAAGLTKSDQLLPRPNKLPAFDSFMSEFLLFAFLLSGIVKMNRDYHSEPLFSIQRLAQHV